MPKNLKETLKTIAYELTQSGGVSSAHADKLSAIIKTARQNAADPVQADATELLKEFRPSDDELQAMGLPKDLPDRPCTNNTPLNYMADFARFAHLGPPKP